MVTHPVSAVSRDLLNLHELKHLALPNPPHTHTINIGYTNLDSKFLLTLIQVVSMHFMKAQPILKNPNLSPWRSAWLPRRTWPRRTSGPGPRRPTGTHNY